ncbi:hypothetical protein HDU91_002630 [Kappamyces sp. JEL0680]|nr:hypothetical protein HDU91_002630 [Kappamyces sp. JEL0680]
MQRSNSESSLNSIEAAVLQVALDRSLSLYSTIQLESDPSTLDRASEKDSSDLEEYATLPRDRDIFPTDVEHETLPLPKPSLISPLSNNLNMIYYGADDCDDEEGDDSTIGSGRSSATISPRPSLAELPYHPRPEFQQRRTSVGSSSTLRASSASPSLSSISSFPPEIQKLMLQYEDVPGQASLSGARVSAGPDAINQDVPPPAAFVGHQQRPTSVATDPAPSTRCSLAPQKPRTETPPASQRYPNPAQRTSMAPPQSFLYSKRCPEPLPAEQRAIAAAVAQPVTITSGSVPLDGRPHNAPFKIPRLEDYLKKTNPTAAVQTPPPLPPRSTARPF